MVLRRVSAVILPLCCYPLYASQDVTELETMVVTATKLETSLDQVPASVSVLEGEDIERAQVTDTFELLRDIPGFTIVQTGSRGGTTSLFARGGNANFNQILIDGVKANQAGGGFDFSDLTTDGIDRIEIVRGPQSALYGSDAITSVVQIFTRRGEGPLAARFGFAGGTFETFEEHAGISGGTERYGYSVDVGRIDADGILDLNNRYGNTTIASRFDLSPLETLDLTATVRFNDSRFEFPTGSAGDRFPPLDSNQFQERDRLIVGPRAVWNPYPWWRHALQLGLYREDRSFDDPFDPGVDSGAFVSDTTEERLSADYNSTFFLPSLAGLHARRLRRGRELRARLTVLVPGLGDAEPHRGEPGHAGLLHSTDPRLARAGDLGRRLPPRRQLDLRRRGEPARGDGLSPPGDRHQAPRELWDRHQGTELHRELRHGKPFRGRESGSGSGALGELGGRLRSTVALRRLSGGSLRHVLLCGFRGSHRLRLRFDAELFEHPAGAEPWRRGRHADRDPDRHRLPRQLHLSRHHRPRSRRIGRPLLRRPEHSGAFTIDYAARRWTASFNLTIKGSSIDRDFNADPSGARVRLDGYTKADVALAYRLIENRLGMESFSITAKGQNVFDEDYEEAFGFSTAGASFLIGFRAEI